MPNKTEEESKVERVTWFALIMVFIILYFDDQQVLPTYVIPFMVAIILIGSSVYQLRKGWRASGIVMGTALILIAFGIYGFVADSGMYDFTMPFPVDLRLISLGAVVGIIIFGIITNEN